MGEDVLVDNLIKSNFRPPYRRTRSVKYALEVKSIYNRPDIVYFEYTKKSGFNFITAIEAKVKNWQVALKQAYRNKLFADRVYVAMPKKYSQGAINNIREFKNNSVGLIIVEKKKYKIYYNPPKNKPISQKHVLKVQQYLTSTV